MSSSARAIANATSRQQQSQQQARPREPVSNNTRQSNQQYVQQAQNVYQQRAGQPVSRQQIQSAQMQAQAAAMSQMQAAYNQYGQGQTPNQGQMYESEQQPVNRVSVTDAISLLSLRMNKFESMVGKLQEAMNELKTLDVPKGSAQLNDSVVKGLLMRIEQLEKSQSTPQQNVFMQQTDYEVNDQISRLATEIADTKDMLLKLQTFSIDTTQKLVDKICGGENKEEEMQNQIFILSQPELNFTNIHDVTVEDVVEEEQDE
jgi:hypothetical protein